MHPPIPIDYIFSSPAFSSRSVYKFLSARMSSSLPLYPISCLKHQLKRRYTDNILCLVIAPKRSGFLCGKNASFPTFQSPSRPSNNIVYQLIYRIPRWICFSNNDKENRSPFIMWGPREQPKISAILHFLCSWAILKTSSPEIISSLDLCFLTSRWI